MLALMSGSSLGWRVYAGVAHISEVVWIPAVPKRGRDVHGRRHGRVGVEEVICMDGLRRQ